MMPGSQQRYSTQCTVMPAQETLSRCDKEAYLPLNKTRKQKTLRGNQVKRGCLTLLVSSLSLQVGNYIGKRLLVQTIYNFPCEEM